MTSFFKKLFGKSDKRTELKSETVKRPEISTRAGVTKNEIDDINTSSDEIKKSYDISEIKKQSTQIKDKDGFSVSIDFVKDFITTNKIEFKELISLLKKIVPYMKKDTTFSDDDILKYIYTEIDKFEDKARVESITLIADIIRRVNNRQGIEYLENKLDAFDTVKENRLLYFDAFILLSDFYLVDKNGELAFEIISKTKMFVSDINDKYDYLSKQKIIAVKAANICLHGQKNPNYTSYIHYEIVAFILEICSDVIIFPHLFGFFERKNTCAVDTRGLEVNKNFGDALDQLNMTKHRGELLNDIYNFTFNELPLKMGIPKEYFNENPLETYSNPTDDFETGYLKRRKIMEAADVFKNIPFNDIGTVDSFATEVVKKYYDIENQNLTKV